MHVTRIATIDPTGGRGPTLANDSDVLITDFLPGIVVECDAEVQSATISRATCLVSVEIPVQVAVGVPSAAPLLGYQALILAGNVGAVGTTIVWQPTPETTAALGNLPSLKLANDRGILAHLTLKGNFIWARSNPALFLDADAFALPQAGTATTSLNLPSGDRRRGGTLDTWFWLIARPVVLTGFSLSISQVSVGSSVIGTVTLSDVAPPGGVTVVVSTSNAQVATVSTTNVIIPAGQTTGAFQVTGAGAGSATISAFFGNATLTAPLTVVPVPIVLANLTFDIVRIAVGGTATGTITLSQVAPPPGVSVALTSSVAGIVDGVPPTLVMSGTATASFVVTGRTVGSTAVQGVLGASRAATLTVFRPKGKEIKEKDKEVKEGAKENLAKEVEIVTPVGPGPIGPVIRPQVARPERSRATRPAAERPPAGEEKGKRRGGRRAFIRPPERPGNG
jgi:hypothetical protein